VRQGGGGASGSGSFTAGPLLSGIAGNQNDTTSAAPLTGAMIYGNATPLWARLAIGTSDQALVVVAGLPVWTSLGVAQGAVGFTTYATGDLIYASAANTLAKRAIGSAGDVLTVVGGIPAWQAPGAGSGTMTSLTMPSAEFTVTNPTTAAVVTWKVQTANLVFAGPATGVPATPTFRALVSDDIPSLVATAKITMSTARLLGRTTAATGLVEEITVSTGLSFAAGVLSCTVTGTVTSVALTAPAEITVTGSPVTTTGTLALTWASAAANRVFAGPDGAPGTPAFRLLVAADIPSLDAGKITTGILDVARGGTGLGAYAAGDLLYATGVATLARRAVGSNGDVLTVVAGLPAWATPGGGSGTMTSLTMPGEFLVTNPTTAAVVTWVNEAANTVLAGPTSGGAATPGFRALVAADIPSLDAGKITTGVFPEVRGGTNQSTYATGDTLYASGANVLAKRAIGATDTVLIVSGGVPTWGTVNTNSITANAVSDGAIRFSAGLSVIGRSAATLGAVADITAAVDGDVLRRSGTTLGFGAIPEASVTGLVADLAGKVPTTRAINTTAPITGGGTLAADLTIAISDFAASGASHARGAVPDPGAVSGTTKFLREDATWQVPAGGTGAFDYGLAMAVGNGGAVAGCYGIGVGL